MHSNLHTQYSRASYTAMLYMAKSWSGKITMDLVNGIGVARIVPRDFTHKSSAYKYVASKWFTNSLLLIAL